MNRKNILIVDTDKDFLLDLRDWVAPVKDKYQVAFAGNIIKVEEMLKRFTVHLVMANVHLSGESGAELLLNIRRWYPGTHVILYDENITEELRRAMFHRGAAGVLNYPFSKEELLLSLDTIFEKEEAGNTLLDSVPLSDFLQLQAMGEGSCRILAIAEDGRRGLIHIRLGVLVEAEMEGEFGAKAIAEMLSLQSPSIRSSVDEAPDDPVDGEPVMQVLLRAAAMLDEADAN